jgi:hypothetical protein
MKYFLNKITCETYTIIQCWQVYKRINLDELKSLFDEYEFKFPKICVSHLKLYFYPSFTDINRIIAIRDKIKLYRLKTLFLF